MEDIAASCDARYAALCREPAGPALVSRFPEGVQLLPVAGQLIRRQDSDLVPRPPARSRPRCSGQGIGPRTREPPRRFVCQRWPTPEGGGARRGGGVLPAVSSPSRESWAGCGSCVGRERGARSGPSRVAAQGHCRRNQWLGRWVQDSEMLGSESEEILDGIRRGGGAASAPAAAGRRQSTDRGAPAIPSEEQRVRPAFPGWCEQALSGEGDSIPGLLLGSRWQHPEVH
jgi:hypothetical protein